MVKKFVRNLIFFGLSLQLVLGFAGCTSSSNQTYSIPLIIAEKNSVRFETLICNQFDCQAEVQKAEVEHKGFQSVFVEPSPITSEGAYFILYTPQSFNVKIGGELGTLKDKICDASPPPEFRKFHLHFCTQDKITS